MLDLTNMKIAILLLFILSALLHLLFIRLYKLGKVGWKVVDYVWLFLAVIGTIGTVAESSKAKLNIIVEERIKDSAKLLQSIKSDADSGSQLPQLIKFAKEKNLNWYTDISKLDAEAYSGWCKSVTAQVADISSGKAQSLDYFKGRYPLGPDVSNISLSRRLSKSILDFAEYNSDVREIARLKEEIKSQEHKILSSKVWSPLLLIIALALRFAKATGELIIERQSQKQQKKQ